MTPKPVSWQDIAEIAVLLAIFFLLLWIGGEQ
jgi:hypothetical protein